MSFADLKKNRAQALEKMTKAAEDAEGSFSKDDRFWQPAVGKDGNGYAVVRFLPAPNRDVPWTRYWDHGFKGPTGKWYIEKSLSSIGKDDPVAQRNSALWAKSTDDESPERKEVRRCKRRLHYVSNILVVDDPADPKNNGQVKLFKFGKKIFDKITDKMQPAFKDEKPINPFDLWDGCDFKIKIRNVEGYRNYDKSEFVSQSPLFGGDETKLENLYKQLHSLEEFTDPKNYKTYDELKKKLDEVLATSADGAPASTAEALDMESRAASKAKSAPAQEHKSAPAPEPKATPAADEGDGDEDTIAYFARLASKE